MTLRDQLLSELRQQNEFAQKEIKKLDADISAATNDAAAIVKKHKIERQNAWISKMLSMYS